jgi:transcriptional regulator GlxA family with amidase domain
VTKLSIPSHREKAQNAIWVIPEDPQILKSSKLRRAINYVEVHLAEPLRSYQLAKIACLSKAHFSRSFKATTGLTPNQFVMNRRLDRAVELLSAADKSLTDIACICGFSDQSHFGRVFKRTLGLTPGAWRRSCMKGDVPRSAIVQCNPCRLRLIAS